MKPNNSIVALIMLVATIMGATVFTQALAQAQTEPPGGQPAAGVSAQEAHDIAVNAYLYFYPLLSMDITRLQSTNIEAGKEFGKGPMNTFVSASANRAAAKEIPMKATRIRSLLGALISALVVTAAHAQASPETKIAADTAAPVKAQEGMVRLADSNIQYFSRGEGEAIVLLPGGTLTVGYLDGVADALARAEYRVVGINFRGSGKSTGSSKGVTLQTNANDVAGVVEALKLGRVHVAGNDFGNRVARMFDASHPELTRSVILLNAGGKIPLKPPAMHAVEVVFNPKSTEAEVLAVFQYFVSNPADSARVWALLKPSVDTKAGGIETAAMKATPLKDWWAPPGQTKYLIVQGAEDQIAPPENGVELKKELGERVTLINVPGAAHLLPLEQPETTASHMINFIRQLGRKP